jgi:hypothetical protein
VARRDRVAARAADPLRSRTARSRSRFEDVHFRYPTGARCSRASTSTSPRRDRGRLRAPPGRARRRCCSFCRGSTIPRPAPSSSRRRRAGVALDELRRVVAIVTQKARPLLRPAARQPARRPARRRLGEVLDACEAAGVAASVDDLPDGLRHADRRARGQSLGRPAPAGRAPRGRSSPAPA